MSNALATRTDFLDTLAADSFAEAVAYQPATVLTERAQVRRTRKNLGRVKYWARAYTAAEITDAKTRAYTARKMVIAANKAVSYGATPGNVAFVLNRVKKAAPQAALTS